MTRFPEAAITTLAALPAVLFLFPSAAMAQDQYFNSGLTSGYNPELTGPMYGYDLHDSGPMYGHDPNPNPDPGPVFDHERGIFIWDWTNP